MSSNYPHSDFLRNNKQIFIPQETAPYLSHKTPTAWQASLFGLSSPEHVTDFTRELLLPSHFSLPPGVHSFQGSSLMLTEVSSYTNGTLFAFALVPDTASTPTVTISPFSLAITT